MDAKTSSKANVNMEGSLQQRVVEVTELRAVFCYGFQEMEMII